MNKRRYQEGVTLIVALVILLLGSIVVLLSMRGTLTQQKITHSQDAKAISFMAAEAGASMLAGTLECVDGDLTHGVSSNPDQPTRLPDENTFFYAEEVDSQQPNTKVFNITGFVTDASGAILSKTRIQIAFNGKCPADDLDPIADAPLSIDLPAPLTIAGPLGNFASFDSDGFSINGNQKPAIISHLESDVTKIKGTIKRGRWDRYTGGGLATPSVASSTLNDSIWGSPVALQDFVTAAKDSGATSDSVSGCANNDMCVVTGDVTFSGTIDSKILIITGNASIQGNTRFNGLLVVLGGEFSWGGAGGGGALNGAIYVANVDQSNDQWTWKLDENGERAKTNVLMTGGGNASLTYDTVILEDAVGELTPPGDWTISAWQEI